MPPLIYICTTASLIPLQTSCSSAPNPVLYYKVMTPQWLEDHASLSQLIAATPENLHFKVNKIQSRLIKLPLFQRGELPTDDIIVTITVHLEDPPTSDSDFLLAICDGTVCNGFWISDSGNYPNQACTYMTRGKSGLQTHEDTETDPNECQELHPRRKEKRGGI